MTGAFASRARALLLATPAKVHWLGREFSPVLHTIGRRYAARNRTITASGIDSHCIGIEPHREPHECEKEPEGQDKGSELLED